MGEEFGYDKERFVNLSSDSFDCPICSSVARKPYDCSACGAVFCESCIKSWLQKKNECINRCPKDFRTAPIARALKKIYDELELKCSICDKPYKIADIERHELLCKAPKCVNVDVCGNVVGQSKELQDAKVCDNICYFLSKIKLCGKDKAQIFAHVKSLVKERGLNVNEQGVVDLQISQVEKNVQPGQLPVFKWDRNRIGQGIVLSDNDQRIFLKEQAYMFRTAVATHGFTGGINYWEIEADERTENELKIGVTSNRDFNYNAAFCDYDFGWAYYGLGQLRHNSNATGPTFGKRFKKEGILGVCLNMNTGTLKISLNGEFMGQAYQDEKLKIGPIYPAVSLLHCAGCRIITGKPAPQIFL